MTRKIIHFKPMTRDRLLGLVETSKKWHPYVGMQPGVLQSWNTDEDYEISQVGEIVLIRGRSMMDKTKEGVIYSSPVLNDAALESFGQIIKSEEIKRIDSIGFNANTLKKITPIKKLKVSDNRDESEYLYNPSELVMLPGKDNEKMRYKINKFKKLYEGRYEIRHQKKLEPSQVLAVYRLFEDWLEFDTDGSKFHPDIEYQALKRTLEDKSFNQFGEHRYTLCYVDNRLVGFVSYMIINDLSVGFFIKNNLNISAISEWMIYSVCTFLKQRGVKTLNAAEDAGIDGLRSFKEQLNPEGLAKIYTVTIGQG